MTTIGPHQTFTDPWTHVQTPLDGVLTLDTPLGPASYVDAQGQKWTISPLQQDPVTKLDKVIPVLLIPKLLKGSVVPSGWTASLPPGNAYAPSPPPSLFGHVSTDGAVGLTGDDLALALEAIDTASYESKVKGGGFPWWLVLLGVWAWSKRKGKRR